MGPRRWLPRLLSDINLDIRANALVFTVLVGLTVRLARGSEPSVRASRCRVLPAIASAAALGTLLAVIASSYEPIAAEAAFRRVYPDSSLKNLLGPGSNTTSRFGGTPRTLERLAEKDGHNPFLQYVTGYELQRQVLDRLKKASAHPEELARSASVSKGEAAALPHRAARHYARAARALPQWPGPHLQVGILGLAGAVDLRPADAGAALLRAAHLDPHHRGVTNALTKAGHPVWP